MKLNRFILIIGFALLFIQTAIAGEVIKIKDFDISVEMKGSGERTSLRIVPPSTSKIKTYTNFGDSHEFQLLEVDGIGVWNFSQLRDVLNDIKAKDEVELTFYVSLMQRNEKAILPRVTAEKNDWGSTGELKDTKPSKVHRDTEAAKRNAAIKYGYLYKNENTWAHYNGEFLRSVFDGNFKYRDGAPVMYGIFLGYVTYFSNNCFKHIDRPTLMKASHVTTTTQQDGRVLGKRTEEKGEYWVESRFSDVFKKFYESYGSTHKTAAQAYNDTEKFIRTFGCDSAEVTQLEENLYRATTNKSSLQSAKTPLEINGFLQDEIFTPGAATSFAAACWAKRDFRITDTYMEFCRCQEGVAKVYYDADELSGVIKNYDRSMRFIEAGRTQRDRDIYVAMRRCAR